MRERGPRRRKLTSLCKYMCGYAVIQSASFPLSKIIPYSREHKDLWLK